MVSTHALLDRIDEDQQDGSQSHPAHEVPRPRMGEGRRSSDAEKCFKQECADDRGNHEDNNREETTGQRAHLSPAQFPCSPARNQGSLQSVPAEGGWKRGGPSSPPACAQSFFRGNSCPTDCGKVTCPVGISSPFCLRWKMMPSVFEAASAISLTTLAAFRLGPLSHHQSPDGGNLPALRQGHSRQAPPSGSPSPRWSSKTPSDESPSSADGTLNPSR